MSSLISHLAAGWSQLHSSVLRYASQIPGTPHGRPLLVSRLENLLERVRQQHYHPGPAAHRHRRSSPRRMSWGGRDDRHGPGYDQVPWDDLLVLCIDHRLKDWPSPDLPVCEGAFPVFETLMSTVFLDTSWIKPCLLKTLLF